jgi:para-aminobenzoate synthetase component I
MTELNLLRAEVEVHRPTVPASSTVARVRGPARIRPASILRHLSPTRGGAIVRDGSTTVVAGAPAVVRAASGEQAFDVLRDIDAGGFWAGFCAYDLGRTIERVRANSVDDLGLPDVAFARYDTRLVIHDDGELELIGDRAGRMRLESALRAAARDDHPPCAPALESWTSSLDRGGHEDACERVLELLRAGECYQVNVTRRLTTPHAPDPIALYDTLTRMNPAPHAALLVLDEVRPGLAVVSASPELFLRIEPADAHGRRRVETRPIKGTGTNAARLAASAKDQAENVMIVDLARNDLGRVCEFGSVRVPALFTVEAHPGLFHLVSTVTGRLRPDVDLAGVVRATFPPASVTGAPKPRVMQAIEDLEPVRRGVYCGAIGWVDGDRGRAELAVAIRTFTIADGSTYLGVGGGIVADSRPDAEWRETELKAARLLAAAGTTADLRDSDRRQVHVIGAGVTS